MIPKETLVMLPGILSDAEFWHNQVVGLAGVCDPQVGDLTTSDSIEGIAQHVLAAAPDRFALAGLSRGGYVAFEIMRVAPERVTRVAFLDTHARKDPLESVPRRAAMKEMAKDGRYSDIAPQLMHNVLHANFLDGPLATLMIEMAERVGPGVFLNHLKAMENRSDSRPGLASIAVPTLVVCGEADVITPPELAREIADGIPNAKLVIIEGAAHLPPLEQPDAVNRALADWLKEERHN